MLRTFAVIGLSTLTASATLASVQDSLPGLPTPGLPTPGLSTRSLDANVSPFPELPEVDLSERTLRKVRSKTPLPARIYRKPSSDRIFLPTSEDGTRFLGTGRIMVKFNNDAGVRAEPYPSRTLISTTGTDLSVVHDLLEAFDGTIQQLIQKSPSELEKLRRIVFERSNRIQPDFAAFTVISFPNGIESDQLLALGRGLNDLEITEFIEFETPVLSASPSSLGGGPRLVPDSNPATVTPDFTSETWLTDPIPFPIPEPIPPSEAYTYPPWTNQNLVLQQYQIGPARDNPLDPDPLPDDNDPNTWFLASKFRSAEGYNIPAMVRLAGQAWRRYGSLPVGPNGTVRDDCNAPGGPEPFCLGLGPNGTPSSGFLGTLPDPNKVWLYGSEFEIIDSETCADWVDINGNSGCETCYEVIPRDLIDPTIVPRKDARNPFPEFATDLQNLQIYENIRLCPTGNVTEIGVIDIAAFRYHEEWLYNRYGDQIYNNVDADGNYDPSLDRPAERKLFFEEGQTMVLLEDQINEVTRSNASHGTAVAGVLNAGNNNFGMTGMVWGSRVRFYPTLSVEEGARLSGAITSAIIDLELGSILCCPIQTILPETGSAPETGIVTSPIDGLAQGPSGSTFIPPNFAQVIYPENPLNALALPGVQHLSSNTVYSSLLNAARDAGLVVVQAAGNGGSIIASDPGGEDSTGVGIICTAVTPSQFVNQADPAFCAFGYPEPPPEICDPNFVSPWGTTPCFYYGNTLLGECSEECPYPGNWSLPWPYCSKTKWPGSNFLPAGGEEGPNVAQRVISGWGMGVASLGYGDFYRNENPPIVPNGEVEPLERDFLRSYTGPRPDAPTYNPSGEQVVADSYRFGNEGFPTTNDPLNHNGLLFQGTSLAASQIAGFSAWMQGFAQMFYGTKLSDDQILVAMAIGGIPVNDCEEQTNGCDNEPTGYTGGFASGTNSRAVDGTAALVPDTPSGPASVIGILTQIGQTFNGDVLVYWGERIRGSKFSLAQANDGNTLQIRAEPANMGQTNEGITYLVTGYTTDLGLILQSPAEPADIITMTLEVTRRVTLTPGAFEVAYARDFSTDRYVPIGVGILGNAFTLEAYDFGAAGSAGLQNFISDDKRVDIRLYSLTFGFIGSPPYNIAYDEVTLLINDANGPNDP